jgi:hypothetical protein
MPFTRRKRAVGRRFAVAFPTNSDTARAFPTTRSRSSRSNRTRVGCLALTSRGTRAMKPPANRGFPSSEPTVHANSSPSPRCSLLRGRQVGSTRRDVRLSCRCLLELRQGSAAGARTRPATPPGTPQQPIPARSNQPNGLPQNPPSPYPNTLRALRKPKRPTPKDRLVSSPSK